MSPQEKAAKMMLSEAIEQVYKNKWKNNKRGLTAYQQANRIIEFVGDIAIGSINDEFVEKLIHKLEVRKVTSATINRYLAGLKTILRYKRQSWDYIKLRKERKGRIRVVSTEEERMAVNLLRYTNHNVRRQFYYDVADLVEVLIDTGCRLSEILNLNYDDVKFDSNLISIWVNKGDRPRSIPMTKRVSRILSSRKENNSLKPFNLTPFQADKAWAWVRKEMGLEGEPEPPVIHSLRHSCASRLVNAGVDLYVVKEWLGHSSIQITERYAHLAPNKLADAATVLEMG
jgi:integrase